MMREGFIDAETWMMGDVTICITGPVAERRGVNE
jgi:hypothetical protein